MVGCQQSHSECEKLSSRKMYQVRIVHSGGDRNQTSEEFNASKTKSAFKILYEMVMNTTPDASDIDFSFEIKFWPKM